MVAPVVQGVSLTRAYRLGSEMVYALNNVSLEVNLGELVAILGRSGSGKSTLLHILGCLQRPDSGRVFIEGLDVTRLGDEELTQVRIHKVGFVFQAFNLLPNETALRNVEFPLEHQGMGAWDRKEKAEEALQTVGLGNRLDRRPGQLSAGQRQCVAIARAIVHNPAVIFADEPTRVLDSTSREEIMGLLQKLNDEGRTIVIATTDSSVASYCHRIMMIAEGRIVDDRRVFRRRIIPPSMIPGSPPRSYARETTVCPRCSYGNFKDEELCRRCEFPLHLTGEEEQAIEGRLSGTESRWLGVESDSNEDAVSGPDLLEEIKELPFFSGIGSKNLIKVVSALEQRHFPKSSMIVKQGDAGDSFYILRSGNVQVVLERRGKTPTPIALLGPKEGFGEMALLTGQPRSASIIAMTDVEVWRLTKTAFERLLSENLSLSLYFNRILSQRLRALQERIGL